MTAISLPALPYDENALAPVISAQTISFHYGKHHAGYVTNLNKLIEGTDYVNLTLEDIIKKSVSDSKAVGIFRNSAQIWNHTFYWNGMKANGGGEPTGKLKSAIESSFGSFKDFKEAFSKASLGAFGSAWVWLVDKGDNKLEIVSTSNADTPITMGQKPLITLDVWEHAYYIDYQNKRADYIAAWLDKVADWSFAEKNMG
jgi:Fe-Mn family superoxide dismutase